jgi:hypothetical protein
MKIPKIAKALPKYSLDTVFKFGKHEGNTVKTVIATDVSYITWCLEFVDNFKLDNEAYKTYSEAVENYFPENYPESYDLMDWSDFQDSL